MLIYWIHVDVNNWSKHKRGTHLNTKPSLFGVSISIWVNMHQTVGIILDLGYLIWCCFFISELLLYKKDCFSGFRVIYLSRLHNYNNFVKLLASVCPSFWFGFLIRNVSNIYCIFWHIVWRILLLMHIRACNCQNRSIIGKT